MKKRVLDKDLRDRLLLPEKKNFIDEQTPFLSKLKTSTKDNIDIFVCTHKDFYMPFNNKAYKIITDKGCKIEHNNGVDVLYEDGVNEITKFQRSFGESSRAYWVRHQYKDRKKYTGLCHYRTFFPFGNTIPDMDSIFEKYDAVCFYDGDALESMTSSMYDNIKRAHDINDFLEICSYIPKLFPDYTYDEVYKYINNPQIGTRNMVILRNEDFDRWTDFWYALSMEFNKNHKLKNENDVLKFVTKKRYIYYDSDHLNEEDIRDVNYQARMNGFYIERLMTIFFKHNFKNILRLPILKTEERSDNYKKKVKKIAVCAIAKGENRYIREWVEYYKKLGVDDIYIYDNNNTYGEHFEDAIGDYIKEGWVKILPCFRGNYKFVQYDAYNIFFNRYKRKYEWIAFLDIDEFVTLKKDKTLPHYLNRKVFKDKHQILLNWICYGDNEKLYYENKEVVKRFPNPIENCPNLEENSYYFNENDTVKCILHASLLTPYIDIIDYAHRVNDAKITHETPGLTFVSCNNKGKLVDTYNMHFVKHNSDLAYIRHYITKTAEEYAYKINRGDVNDSKKRIATDFFFRANSYSPQKQAIINKIVSNEE